MRALSTAVLSTVLCAATAASAFADEIVAPSTVRKERISSTQVRLTWKDLSVDEDGFQILRRPVTESQFESRGTVGAGITEFVDDAARDTVFIYQVRAIRDGDVSDLSNQCFVNRPRPPVPLYFNARLIALHVVRIGWSDRSDGERGFEIQRAPLGSTRFKTVVRVEPNLETYDDYTLEPATSYVYRMRALGRPAICWDDSVFTTPRAVTTKGGVRVLTVELRGRGKGKVTSSPAGISCSPTDDHCSAEFPLGVNVTLTAKSRDSSHFAGWVEYGPCKDTKTPCTVNIGEDDKLVGAVFRLNQ